MKQTLVLAACCVILATASTARSQGFGSGSSAFGNSGFGRSGFGSGMSGFGGFGSGMSGFGNSGFGGGGFGSSGFGGGGFGSGMSGFGGFGSGTSGFGGMGSGMSGFGGSQFGNTGMSGLGGGQSFVGRDSADMASTWTQMSQAGTQFFNQMNRNMSRNNRNQDNSGSKVANVPQPMLVNLRVAFDTPRQTPNQLSETIRTRLGSILNSQGIALPEFTIEGDVVVLRGAAASESQRMVMEQLVAMEPGVKAVRNEMTVLQPDGTTATE